MQTMSRQEAAKLYLFGGHCVEIVDKAEKETVFNDLWQLDLKTYQVRHRDGWHLEHARH
jgi:hypothetical protein